MKGVNEYNSISLFKMEFKINGNVIYDGRKVLKSELLKEVRTIKKIISGIDIRQDEIIAIALSRTPQLLTTIFSLLDLQIPFLLLDSSQPKERLQYMIKKVGIQYIIADQLSGFEQLEGVKFINLGSDVDCKNVFRKMGSSVAYVLYTSGSTGMPKAVAVTRKGFINFIQSIPEIIGFREVSKIACISNASFDIFLLESVLALQQGLTVVLAMDNECKNPRMLSKLIQTSSIDIIQMTPSMLKLLHIIDKEFYVLKNVKKLLIGGEPFPEYMLPILQKNVNSQIFNMYGPTETTIWSTVSDLTNKRCVDIGEPIANTQIFLLDEYQEEVNKGVMGEICIAGVGLAQEYLNDNNETSNAFIYINRNGTRIRVYKTGDYGIYSPLHQLLCLGRKDNQVKVRGHRIELDEIDNLLLEGQLSHIYVTCTCLYRDNKGDFLITFYTSAEEVDSDLFIKYLSLKIPEYMVPQIYVRIEHLPYTTSGKVDRNQLLILYDNMNQRFCCDTDLSQSNKSLANDSIKEEVESFVICASREILKKSNVDINLESQLELLGFDSLSLISLFVEIEDKYEIRFEDDMLIENAYSNIGDIVNYSVSLIKKEVN